VRTALVTGSSRGLGRTVAEQLLNRGYSVVGCSRTEVEFSHQSYRHYVADVTDEIAVRRMFHEMAVEKIYIDVLINNAGMSASSLALWTSPQTFADVINVNLVGAFIVTREAIRVMKARGFGRIINFSSINVPLSSVGGAPYNASKAGLENLSATLARECGADDITVNCVGLAVVADTGMADHLAASAINEKQMALMKPASVDIEQVMHVIEFFAAPEARNITAQTTYFGGLR
jgi:3-oxoacyl-[acyl-carrier protein] reductase